MGVISFVVFLYSVDVSSKRDIFVRYYFFAVGMYGTGVSWIFVSINDFGGVSLLASIGLTAAFILSYSFTSLMGALLHVNVRDGLVAFPAIWVILEWFRSWFLTGFPWLYAGYSHLESPLSGYIPIAGVYGLSLLTVVTSVLIYKLPSSKWPLNIFLIGLVCTPLGLNTESCFKGIRLASITALGISGIDNRSTLNSPFESFINSFVV